MSEVALPMRRQPSEPTLLQQEMSMLNGRDIPAVAAGPTFWDLHQKLGECYRADILAVSGGTFSANLGHMSVSMHHRGASKETSKEHRDDDKSRGALRQVSEFPRQTSEASHMSRMVSPYTTPSIYVPQNVRTLLDEIEGREESEEQDHFPQVDLKPHNCFKASTKTSTSRSQKRAVSVDALGMFAQTKSHSDLPRRETHGFHRKVNYICGGEAFHPGGHFRTGWNLAVALCVLYDLIFVPLEVFEIYRSTFVVGLEWTTQIFWNFDFLVSLRTGYYKHGALVLDTWKSAKHYMKSWMAFDMMLITLDWAIVFIQKGAQQDSEDQGLAQWSGALQLLRFLRLARMLRWVKLQRVNEVFQELLHSQAASLYYALCGSIARLLILNHFVSCAWYGVGRLGGSDGWLANRTDSDLLYNYLDCLNWAYAQLSVGSSDIMPTNTLELAFCCLIAFRSLLTYSTLISTMTSLMTGLSKIKEDEATEFRMLRNYLRHHDIPKELQQKIVRFLQNQYSLKQQAKSAKSNVPLLELLSPQLTGELHFERYRKDFCKITFLKKLALLDDFQTVQVLQKVALTAVGDIMVAAKDVVFLGGSIGSAAYLPVNGSISYYHSHNKDYMDGSVWLAEACLWTNWIYMGDLLAEDVSHLAVMDAKLFCDCVCECITTQKAATGYAREFLKRLERTPNLSDVLPPEESTERRTSILPDLHLLSNKKSWCCCWPFGGSAVTPEVFDPVTSGSSNSLPPIPGSPQRSRGNSLAGSGPTELN